MTFVVGENCIRCKHTDCVEVCPVDCFYEGPNMLVINPDVLTVRFASPSARLMPSMPKTNCLRIRLSFLSSIPNSVSNGQT